MDIAACYGYKDMDISNSGQAKQTLDQEYEAYVTAQLSDKNTDILKFWEVGGHFNSAQMLLTRCCRSTVHPFPLSSQLQWTTSQSSHPLFLANVSFHQVLKRTQSGGIASAPS